jgi:hypothetical protein
VCSSDLDDFAEFADLLSANATNEVIIASLDAILATTDIYGLREAIKDYVFAQTQAYWISLIEANADDYFTDQFEEAIAALGAIVRDDAAVQTVGTDAAAIIDGLKTILYYHAEAKTAIDAAATVALNAVIPGAGGSFSHAKTLPMGYDAETWYADLFATTTYADYEAELAKVLDDEVEVYGKTIKVVERDVYAAYVELSFIPLELDPKLATKYPSVWNDAPDFVAYKAYLVETYCADLYKGDTTRAAALAAIVTALTSAPALKPITDYKTDYETIITDLAGDYALTFFDGSLMDENAVMLYIDYNFSIFGIDDLEVQAATSYAEFVVATKAMLDYADNGGGFEFSITDACKDIIEELVKDSWVKIADDIFATMDAIFEGGLKKYLSGDLQDAYDTVVANIGDCENFEAAKQYAQDIFDTVPESVTAAIAYILKLAEVEANLALYFPGDVDAIKADRSGVTRVEELEALLERLNELVLRSTVVAEANAQFDSITDPEMYLGGAANIANVKAETIDYIENTALTAEDARNKIAANFNSLKRLWSSALDAWLNDPRVYGNEDIMEAVTALMTLALNDADGVISSPEEGAIINFIALVVTWSEWPESVQGWTGWIINPVYITCYLAVMAN